MNSLLSHITLPLIVAFGVGIAFADELPITSYLKFTPVKLRNEVMRLYQLPDDSSQARAAQIIEFYPPYLDDATVSGTLPHLLQSNSKSVTISAIYAAEGIVAYGYFSDTLDPSIHHPITKPVLKRLLLLLNSLRKHPDKDIAFQAQRVSKTVQFRLKNLPKRDLKV